MAGNKAINDGSDHPSSYEAAVLDFLDREMAAVQPPQKINNQSDELDALVSDLLRQVITESDKSESSYTGISDELENLAIEFPPTEEAVLYARSEALASPATIPPAPISQPIHLNEPAATAATVVPAAQTLQQPSSTSPVAPTVTVATAVTAATAVPAKKISESRQSIPIASPTAVPVFTGKLKSGNPRAAIASVCLLVIMGLAAYYFWGRQKETSKADNSALSSRPLSAAPAASEGMIPAVPISQIAPRYPEFAVRTRAAASIILDLQIDEQGKVVKAVPVSGPYAFHKEAINAALRWRFQPASINGAKVTSQSRVTMNFLP
jgi:TonB family protein